MNVLRVGSTGPEVEQWQNFLLGKGFYHGLTDGSFGPATKRATITFQMRFGLGSDGVVGRSTWAKAVELGFGDIYDEDGEEDGENWPPRPDFSSPNDATRAKLFGRFAYVPAPVDGNKEAIKIQGTWVRDNVTRVEVPQLVNVLRAPQSCQIDFHKAAAPQLKALFKAWEEEGLINLVLTWGGSFAPRFIRGSQSVLSNHSFASAFDINVSQNGLGVVPPVVGAHGSVRKLVPLANRFGFFWGGHYPKRPDGMHFEVAKIVQV